MEAAPIKPLTTLRFFAAMAVVFYHFGQQHFHHPPEPLKNLMGAGFVGVSFFYVLSGFLLAYGYVNPAKRENFRRSDFWAGRFARIYPVYLVSLVLAIPSFMTLVRTASAARSGLALILCLSLTQSWGIVTAADWNFPAWSLSVEVFFYATFPWTAAGIRKLSARSLLLLASGLWILSMALATAYVVFNPDGWSQYPSFRYAIGHPNPNQFWSAALIVFPLLRLPEFLIGLAIGGLFVTQPRYRIRFADAFALLAMAAIVGTVAFGSFLPFNFFATSVLAPAYCLLIYALASSPSGPVSRLLSFSWLVLLGEASYGIYILQAPVFHLCRRVIGQSAPAALASAGILVGVSVLSFVYFETPARRWLRKKLVSG